MNGQVQKIIWAQNVASSNRSCKPNTGTSKVPQKARNQEKVSDIQQCKIIHLFTELIHHCILLLHNTKNVYHTETSGMSAYCEVTQGVDDAWASCPTLLEVFGFEVEGQGFVIVADFQLTFSFLVVEVEHCLHRFCCVELKLPPLEVFTYGCYGLYSARLPQFVSHYHHAWLIVRQRMRTFWRLWLAGQTCNCWGERDARKNSCGKPFLMHRSVFRLPFSVVRVKLRLPTIPMIMRTMCLSGSNSNSLQMRRGAI